MLNRTEVIALINALGKNANQGPGSGPIDLTAYDMRPVVEAKIAAAAALKEDKLPTNADTVKYLAKDENNQVTLLEVPAIPDVTPFLPKTDFEEYKRQQSALPTLPKNTVGRNQLLVLQVDDTYGLIDVPRVLNTYSCEEIDDKLRALNIIEIPNNLTNHPQFVQRQDNQTFILTDLPEYELAQDARDAHNQLQTNIAQEVTDRTNADALKQDLLPTNTQNKRLFVTKEADDSVSLAEVDFTDVNDAISQLRTDLTTETTDRTINDTTLQTNIDTLTTSKQDLLPTNTSGIRKFVTKEADDSVGLQDVDFTTMQTKIDALETKHDAYETSNDAAVALKQDKLPSNTSGVSQFVTIDASDNIVLAQVDFTQIQNDLAAEVTNRTNADAALRADIDAHTGILANKVDKVAGKQLSTNDYTDAEKAKLAALEAGGGGSINATFSLSGSVLTITTTAS